MSLGQELLNVPMGEMIRDMALAIAEAQVQLDAASLTVAEMMSGRVWELDENGHHLPESASNPRDTRVAFGYDMDEDGARTPNRMSMMELGFSPTFYQFVDTIIEVKIAIKITRDRSYTVNQKINTDTKKWRWSSKTGLGRTVQTSQVDATYTSKYGYSAEGSSLLRTKLVPVPPPAILEERIRLTMEAENASESES